MDPLKMWCILEMADYRISGGKCVWGISSMMTGRDASTDTDVVTPRPPFMSHELLQDMIRTSSVGGRRQII